MYYSAGFILIGFLQPICECLPNIQVTATVHNAVDFTNHFSAPP